jgi:TPR repeat protein
MSFDNFIDKCLSHARNGDVKYIDFLSMQMIDKWYYASKVASKCNNATDGISLFLLGLYNIAKNNYTTAEECFNKSIEANCSYGYIGSEYLLGNIHKTSLEKRMEFLNKAIEIDNNPFAYRALGMIEEVVNEDLDKALLYYIKAIEFGSKSAIYNMAIVNLVMYRENNKRAKEETKSDDGMTTTDSMTTSVVIQCKEKADSCLKSYLTYLHDASDNMCMSAIIDLAELYMHGTYVDQDFDKVIELYKKGVEFFDDDMCVLLTDTIKYMYKMEQISNDSKMRYYECFYEGVKTCRSIEDSDRMIALDDNIVFDMLALFFSKKE